MTPGFLIQLTFVTLGNQIPWNCIATLVLDFLKTFLKESKTNFKCFSLDIEKLLSSTLSIFIMTRSITISITFNTSWKRYFDKHTFFYIFIPLALFIRNSYKESFQFITKCNLIQKYDSKNYLRISYNTTVSQNFILLIFASRLIYLPSVFVFISYSDCNFIHMCLRIQCVCIITNVL